MGRLSLVGKTALYSDKMEQLFFTPHISRLKFVRKTFAGLFAVLSVLTHIVYTDKA